MYRKKIRLLIGMLCFFLLTQFISGCSSKPDFNGYWNRFPTLGGGYSNILRESIIADDIYYVLNSIGVVLINDLNQIGSTGYYMHYMSNSLDYRPIMSEDFAAYFPKNQPNRIYFKCYDIRGIASITTSDFGEEFSDYIFWQGNSDVKFGAINDQNRFVAMMTDLRIDNYGWYSSGLNNYLVYIDLEKVGDSLIIRDKGYWTIPEMFLSSQLDSNLRVHMIESYHDQFYVSYENPRSEFYCYHTKLFMDGSHITTPNLFGIYQNLYSIFEYRGVLFGNLHEGGIIFTIDQENWFDTGLVIHPRSNKWKEIGDYLFLFLADNIYIFEYDFEDVHFYQVQKENMVGAVVTSVNLFRDDVVVTSSSGIFFKPYKDLVRDKILLKSSSKSGILKMQDF